MKMKDIKEFLGQPPFFLENKGLEAACLEAEVLLAHVLGTDRLRLYLTPDRPLDPEEIRKYKEVIRLPAHGDAPRPTSRKKAFLKWEFKVTPEVLVPRPETELLVEKAVEAVNQRMAASACAGKERGACDLLDLGNRSGAVAVALAHYLPECRIDAVDISPAAVAKWNGKCPSSLGMEERITFYMGISSLALPAEKISRDCLQPPIFPVMPGPPCPRRSRREPRVALDGGGRTAWR